MSKTMKVNSNITYAVFFYLALLPVFILTPPVKVSTQDFHLALQTVQAQTYGSGDYGDGQYGGDETAPTLTIPTDSETGQTTSSGSVTTDEAGGTLYWVVTTSATTPTATQLIAGQDHTGTAAAAAGSQAAPTTGAQTTSASGLSANTAYYTHYMHEDVYENRSTVVSAAGFTTSAAADVTAPVLSAAVNTATGQTTSSGSVTTDEAGGTLYWVVTTSATTPTATQLIAGQDAASVSASAAGSQAVGTVGVQSTAATSLSAETTYYTHFFHQDASGNQSIPVSATSFTTSATPSSSGGGGGGSGSRSSSGGTIVNDTPNDEVPVSVEPPAETSSTTIQTTIPAGFTFKKNISALQPMFNNLTDVQRLAQFLNEFEGEKLPVDSIYSPADVEAVKRFQRKYSREILDVWGLTEATGFVGITTRLKMNFLLQGQTAQCPAFVEYNGGLNGIFNSEEIQRTKQILFDLDMYKGVIDQNWTLQTHDAMVRFQETFREVMLDPWNITKGTGYKYKTTNKFLNYFVGCNTGAVELEGVGVYEGL